MPDFLKRYATPLITGLFLVSLVSGVALFFHLGQSAFRGMHESLSMVLIVPFVLHLWRNWRAMVMYIGRAPFSIVMAASLAAAVAFAYPAIMGTTSRAGGPPPFTLAQTVVQHKPGEVAPVLGLGADELVAALQGKGFAAASPDLTLAEVATKAGKSSADMIAALVQVKK
ncbi:MAG: DUF4405 domain-containing protein [Alphaproteobacteria bacterium]|nr:DUF4405 domain-containing protein [Alphaproteobacteria bacterium]